MPVSESVNDSPPTSAGGPVFESPSRNWYRRRRTVGSLAVLLAAAVAVTLFVNQDDTRKPVQPKPATAKDPVNATQARRLARETGKEVEVTGVASAYTSTWAQPGGTFKLRVSSLANRAKVGNEWKPIDTTLQRVDGGFAPKAVNGKVVFSAGTKAPNGGNGSRAARGASRVALVQPSVAKADTPRSRLGPISFV